MKTKTQEPKKRVNGSGTVHQLPDGRWRWQSAPIPPTGKRISQIFDTEKEADEAREEGKVDLKRGAIKAPSDRTVAEQLQEWWTDHQGGWARNTAANYRRAIQLHLIPAIGHLKIHELQSPHIRELYRSIGSGQSPRSQHRPQTLLRTVKTALNGAMETAVDDGLILKNPAAKADFKVVRTVEQSITPYWTLDQAKEFLGKAPDTAWGRVFRFGLLTGLRRGEILGLRWRNVVLDDDKPRIYVVDNWTKADGVNTLTTLKAASRRRWLRIGGQALQLLRRCWVLRGDCEHVFTSDRDTPLSPDNADRALKVLCQQLDLPLIPPHGLRHTYVSVQRSLGVSIERISHQIGHARPTVTLAIYSHLFAVELDDLTLDLLEEEL